MSYTSEYNSLCADAARIEKFRASGKEGRRIFSVLNSNIKSLKTVGEYIRTMYSQTSYNATYKQMNERIRAFNFRSLDNHTDQRAIIRSDIVMSACNQFGGYDHAFVTLILYILLLDVGTEISETVVNAQKFIESLPVFIKRQLFTYARKIALSEGSSFPYDNLLLEMVVLYGDAVLFKEFICHICENYPNEQLITSLFIKEAANSQSPIAKRISNFQQSALKKDALYTMIFYSLDQYVRKCKMKGMITGKKIIKADVFFNGYLDFFDNSFSDSLGWLGKINNTDNLDALKNFISNSLSLTQQEEIYQCIINAFNLKEPK